MTIRHITATLVSLLIASEAFAWGQVGHDTTCSIAENHLTKKAKKQISKVLDGQSIVYWANWLDNASHQPEYEYTKTWHYKNIEAGQQIEDVPPFPTGDIITVLQDMYEKLKSHSLPKEEEALTLKMFVHLMGDLHQPMHMGHNSDVGGNKWNIKVFNESANLHHAWDEELVEFGHRWTYTEWTNQLDRKSKKEIEAIVAGDFFSWGKETWEYSKQIYEATPIDYKISYDYIADWTPLVEQQFLKGGLRLARLLNEIYK